MADVVAPAAPALGKSGRFFVGSYATLPKKAPDLEADFYEGLAALPLCGGLELGLTLGGAVCANHSNDEAWLLECLSRLGAPRRWRYVLTAVTATMAAIEHDPHCGLASDDERGRAEAVELGRRACAAVARLNAAVGDRVVAFVQLQAGPSRHGAAAATAGVASSAASLARSLKELVALDWQGARLMLEHCDAYDGVAPVKGLLPLSQEIAALKEVNDGISTKVSLTVNWARSVLEARDTAAASTHLSRARNEGLLGGIMFSGCCGASGPFGSWTDTHMPHALSPELPHGAEGSLLTADEVCHCLDAAGGPSELAYIGIKIAAKHKDDKDVTGRLAVNGELLTLLAEAVDAAAASGGSDVVQPLAKKPRAA